MAKFMYVMEIDTDADLEEYELAELEQLVVDYLTPESVTRVAIDLVDGEDF